MYIYLSLNGIFAYSMKQNFLLNRICLVITCGLLFTCTVFSQSVLTGKVQEANGEALVGVNVKSSADSGTITDVFGNFELLLTEGTHVIEFSYIGFKTKTFEITLGVGERQELSLDMEVDVLEMDEVVISAGFNQKSKLESSVAITTLDNTVVESLSPASPLEALKQVPGIFVNGANGEVGVEIVGRGLGTQFFSIQEDGLPSSISELASNELFTRDMFLRNDLTVSRIEAVRGGNSAVTTANAPGGVFNYINRTGTDRQEFEIRNRFGLHANGNEVFNKLEIFKAGPIEGTDWKYAIGGHYRFDGGNRVSLFPHSQGGQLKGNLQRVFNDRLSVKLYGKYLNDRVGFNRPTWVQNFQDIRAADGFDFDDNLILPDAQFDIIDGENSRSDSFQTKTISTRDQQSINEITGGAKFSYSLGDNWNVSSHTRVSRKSLIVNHLAEEGGFASVDLTGLFPRLFPNFNWLSPISDVNEVFRNTIFGQTEFYDINTNEVLAIVDNAPLLRGGSPEILLNNLPGDNEIFWGLVDNDELDLTEFIQQVDFNGTINNHQLTVGGYYSSVDNSRVLNSATSFLTFETLPRLLGTRVILDDFSDIAAFVPSLQPLVPFAGQTIQFANPTGLHGFNAQVNEYNELTERVFAVYVNDEWKITDALTAEAGVRYEVISHNGTSGITDESNISENPNGQDGDFLTVYDNAFNHFSGETFGVDENYNALSYSLGINYKISDNAAVYARYSDSEKLLDAIYLQERFVDGESFEFVPREVNQIELGAKYSNSTFGLFGSIYRSQEKNIFRQELVICLSCDGGFYLTEPIFNSVEHFGAELELSIKPTKWWNIQANLNVSGGNNIDFRVVNTGQAEGPEDDFIVDLSGEPVAGSTTSTFSLSPLDVTNRFIVSERVEFLVNYRRFAERFANSQQAFTLPGFHIFKVGVTAKVNNHVTLALNINNVFDDVGLLNFSGFDAVAGFPENVTPEFVEEFPDTRFKVQRSLPRAFYFTIHYKL